MIFNRLPELLCIAGSVITGFTILRYGFSVKKIKNELKVKIICISLAVSAVTGTAFCSMSYLQNHKDRSYTLKYNYEEASSGLCPNGTWLNVSDTIGDEVLEKIKQKTGYKNVKGLLNLSSAMDETALDSKHPKIATDYSISCTKKALSKDTDKLIHAAAESYQEYFMEHCAEQIVPLEINLDMDGLEYQETADRLQIEAEKLKDFLSGYKWDNQGYQTDTNFSSLVQKTDDFINVELEKYKSFITENGITKDASDFKQTMEYKNILLKRDYDKMMASYNVNLEAIDLYNSNMVSVVLVPTQDKEDNFYMSRTKIGVDYFATDASNYSSQAATIKQEMDENKYQSVRVSENSENSQDKANIMLVSLEQELQQLSDQAQDFFKQFLKTKRDGYIKIVFRSVTLKQALDLKGNLIKAIFLGMCVFVILAERKKS